MQLLLASLVFAADLAAAVADPPAGPPERVKIEAIRYGYVDTQKTLTIVRSGPGYSDGQRKIDPRLVRALSLAVFAPTVEKPALDRLGLTVAQLRDQARARRWPPDAVSRLAARLADPASFAELATAFYEELTLKVDGGVSLSVEITYGEGREVRLFSRTKRPFMLPWSIWRDGPSVDSYDPAIARALAALLPANFLLRSLLTSKGLVPDLLAQAQRLWPDLASEPLR